MQDKTASSSYAEITENTPSSLCAGRAVQTSQM